MATGILWASSAILHPSPERRHYLHRRARGDRHVAALRHLFNRMLGQLHHCLQTDQHFNQEIGYPEYFSPAALEAIDLDTTADPMGLVNSVRQRCLLIFADQSAKDWASLDSCGGEVDDLRRWWVWWSLAK